MRDAEAGSSSPSPLPRATVVLLSLGGASATIFGLWAIQPVAAPVALALVLSICAHPVRGALERIRVPRGVATVLAILLVVALLAGFVASLLIALTQFTTLLPQFTPQMEQIGQDIVAWLASVGVGVESAQTIIAGFDPAKLLDLAAGLLGGITGIVFSLVVIITLVMLMAMDATYLPPLFSELHKRRPTLVSAMNGFAVSVRRYMVAATGLGVLQSTMNFIALALLGVPAPFLWALLSFICSYIPNVGYFLAIIPPTVFGLLVGGWPIAIAVILIYGIINMIVQSIVQPLLVSNVVALNQTITFVSVLFWTPVLGPVGAVLAVPLTLLVRALLLDADPDAAWWRPLTGDIDAAKSVLRAKDADNRRKRAARRSAVRGEREAAVEGARLADE
ncbi:putative PurR-regulated permease PerM [Okibacterium sp. HSC-33S16]|uniref:AI-2E family transporter n=1 Tax=Okibacterium sp. HSC-33S16 TaxID=2910965 RepID=UPI0020A0B222|nr:AI-2E family transporter [Okibacterium sp. HSC-33S16]MCP2032656.1 putative PurR-regulated permease PerM [Okibacterium sp. HSC-33S16]